MIHKTMLVCNLFDKAIIANGKTSAIKQLRAPYFLLRSLM